MPPVLAFVIWLVSLLFLLRYDPARDPKVSAAVWVPILAMFITGSRNPSQWFSGQVTITAQAFEEGNPLDRTISLVLILLAIGILMSRSFKLTDFFARNLTLTVFIVFSLISITWSDFAFVAFKRWFRDLGSYLYILVILTEARPLEAVRTVLRRLSYLLIPLSIMLNKYFEGLSRAFDQWTGIGYYSGATTSKNMLGLICLISGLYFCWDIFARWSNRRDRQTKRILQVDAAFLLMTLYLLNSAHSTTSSVCLVMGAGVMATAYSKTFRRHPGFLKWMIPAAFFIYLILDFGFNLNGQMAASVGKDPTLTDRTKIWAFLLSMHTNPIIGTGYQSFWLGSRLDYFWTNSGLGHINEAHNGYLAVYLDLGLIGVGLLSTFLISSYRRISRLLTQRSDLGAFGLASWFVLVFYNMSEAAFPTGLLFMVYLMSAIAMPARVMKTVRAQGIPTGSAPNTKSITLSETYADGTK